MDVVNINSKFDLINEHWSPKIISSLNGQDVKIAKIKGEFIWHSHKDADELFMVIKGELKMAFRDHTKIVSEGEIIVVPKGVEHKPIAEEEVHIMMFEPVGTVNTGDIIDKRTVEDIERI